MGATGLGICTVGSLSTGEPVPNMTSVCPTVQIHKMGVATGPGIYWNTHSHGDDEETIFTAGVYPTVRCGLLGVVFFTAPFSCGHNAGTASPNVKVMCTV